MQMQRSAGSGSCFPCTLRRLRPRKKESPVPHFQLYSYSYKIPKKSLRFKECSVEFYKDLFRAGLGSAQTAGPEARLHSVLHQLMCPHRHGSCQGQKYQMRHDKGLCTVEGIAWWPPWHHGKCFSSGRVHEKSCVSQHDQ